jgi:hypothetical protein
MFPDGPDVIWVATGIDGYVERNFEATLAPTRFPTPSAGAAARSY